MYVLSVQVDDDDDDGLPGVRRLPLLLQWPLRAVVGRALQLPVQLAEAGRGGPPPPNEIEDDCYDWIDG